MSEKQLLDIRLQMESLISLREGMVAENKIRESRGESMAYTDQSFCENADAMDSLLSVLRSL